VRADDQEEFFNSVGYTIRAFLCHITTQDVLVFSPDTVMSTPAQVAEASGFVSTEYSDWTSIPFTVPAPTETTVGDGQMLYLRVTGGDGWSSDPIKVYVNTNTHGTPDCAINSYELSDSLETELAWPCSETTNVGTVWYITFELPAISNQHLEDHGPL